MLTGELRVSLAAGEDYSAPLDVAITSVVIGLDGELLQDHRTALLIEAVGSLVAAADRPGPVVRIYLKQPEGDDDGRGKRRENVSRRRAGKAQAGADGG